MVIRWPLLRGLLILSRHGLARSSLASTTFVELLVQVVVGPMTRIS